MAIAIRHRPCTGFDELHGLVDDHLIRGRGGDRIRREVRINTLSPIAACAIDIMGTDRRSYHIHHTDHIVSGGDTTKGRRDRHVTAGRGVRTIGDLAIANASPTALTHPHVPGITVRITDR